MNSDTTALSASTPTSLRHSAVLSAPAHPHLPLNLKVDTDLELSILDGDDAEEVFAVISRNKAHLRPWLPWPDAVHNVEDERVFILGSYATFEENNTALYGIRYRGHIIGVVGLPWIDWGGKECAMGYWLDAVWTGHGFVTRCCKEVLRTCFEQLHLERVILQIAVNNQKSRQVAKRMGMRLEGVMEDKWKILLGPEGMSEPYACALQFSISCSEWRSQMKTELD